MLRDALRAIESAPKLDRPASTVGQVAERAGAGRLGAVLRGDWLGHALHPLLTDFPLGCWLSSGLLDLSGAKAFRPASRRLVGLGLVFTLPTVAAGMADYGEIDDTRSRRVATVHAIGNATVGLAYLMSWNARRRGHHWRGVVWGLAGGSGAWATGYLGGHLSFARRVGTGERGMDLETPGASAMDDSDRRAEEQALIASGARPVIVDGESAVEGPNSA